MSTQRFPISLFLPKHGRGRWWRLRAAFALTPPADTGDPSAGESPRSGPTQTIAATSPPEVVTPGKSAVEGGGMGNYQGICPTEFASPPKL